jgi:ABC-type Mn2+/Zn2+ transport system permease subunit
VIDLIVEPLGYDIFLRSLLSVVLVGTVCAVVGTFVVLKGLAFIGDAISHAAFPGVVAAYLLGGSYVVGAAIAAIATSLAIRWTSQRGGLRADTAIGVLFAGMFAFGILLYSTIRGYVGDLFAILVGNVLAISPTDLVALAVLSVATLAVVGVLWKELLYSTFDPLGAAASGLRVGVLEYLFLALVAVAIVISLQAVGIILVVAMLVTPAAAAQLLTVRFGRLMGLAVVIGVGSSVVGLYLSFWLDVASGATIVLTQTAVFAGALLLGPRRGARSRRVLRRTTAEPAGTEPR